MESRQNNVLLWSAIAILIFGIDFYLGYQEDQRKEYMFENIDNLQKSCYYKPNKCYEPPISEELNVVNMGGFLCTFQECRKLPDYCLDECIYQIAFKNENSTICNQINNESNRLFCLNSIQQLKDSKTKSS